jgi:uncharacterized protein YheU (UPF0270 family)
VASFLQVPPERIAADTLAALLEEFASRDGTDYGEREVPLAERRLQLEHQLRDGELALLYDSASECWDIVPRQRARELLGGSES